jgi:putative glutamine amidotransferase
MAQPLIGITTSVVTKEPERVQLNASYIRAVQEAGGIPLLLPPQLSPATLGRLLGGIEGLLLTGGGDVDPARYGEERDPSLAYVSEERDTLEIAAVHACLERNVPLLAICRGVQLLNVALGGSLHQHIPSAFPGAGKHNQGDGPDEPGHSAWVQTHTKLAALTGDGDLEVNSRHHQAIKALGRNLQAVAWAPDGIIEAVETVETGRFVVGVQWHPEDMTATAAHARDLFAGFVESARQGRFTAAAST